MLRIEKPVEGGLAWPARFISRATFIACQAHQDETIGRALSAAFAGGGMENVTSFRLDSSPDDTCGFKGDGWWLSVSAS